MRYEVCILSAEEAFARMLLLELEDRGLHAAHASSLEVAATTEADCYLIDADAFSFTPRTGRAVLYGRQLADAGSPCVQLHRPFLLRSLHAAVSGGSRERGLALAEGECAAFLDGERISLTEREYACLSCLYRANGAPVSRAQLLADVWGEGETDPGVVNVYLHYLRKKLERRGKKMIYAIRGRGYALRYEEVL